MKLTDENYYSSEANREYMSVSQYKDFAGTYGKLPCEFTALKKMKGEWVEEPNTAMMIGSYVDRYFEGTLDNFKEEHPEIFLKSGGLKSDFRKAEDIIKRIEKDEYFMKFLSGEKQTIMEADLFGTKWKIKMDSYIPDVAIVDLKVMATITKLNWVRDIGYLDFVRYWGYDIQGAVYQKVVEINAGKKLPFYLACATKEDEPDIEIIEITQPFLDEALSMVEANMPRILKIKNGEEEPMRCQQCNCCRHNKVLDKPISITDLLSGI